jgi:cytoskeletal protein CcmA (bactofilin family)
MAFGIEKKPGYGDSSSGSFFGKTMRIEGEITSNEDITIEGKVDGQLEVSKTLTIGRDGYVKGEISANVVHISGEAEGHIKASEKLEISSQGKYNGDIQSDKIIVAEGALIKGTINLQKEQANSKEMVKPAIITDQEAQPEQEEKEQPKYPEEKEIPPTSDTSKSKQK